MLQRAASEDTSLKRCFWAGTAVGTTSSHHFSACCPSISSASAR
jgi:hypothetical protein